MNKSLFIKALAMLLVTASISHQANGMQTLRNLKQWYNEHPNCKKAVTALATVIPIVIVPALLTYKLTDIHTMPTTIPNEVSYMVLDPNYKVANSLLIRLAGFVAGGISGLLTYRYPEIVSILFGAASLTALSSVGLTLGKKLAVKYKPALPVNEAIAIAVNEPIKIGKVYLNF